MREMLATSSHAYDVTHSFAFFTAITCWVVQRVRDTRRPVQISRFDAPSSARAFPWQAPASSVPSDLSAYWYFVGLRNAVAHGDDRNVSPRNEHSAKLKGYELQCSAHRRVGEQKQLIWEGNVFLSGAEMRRLGMELADAFCLALENRVRDVAVFRAEAGSIAEAA